MTRKIDITRRGPTLSQAEELAQLVDMIRRDPLAAVEVVAKDPWKRWLLPHGMDIFGSGLNEWEVACLRCIVRHSGEEGRIKQHWLFEGGPDRDPELAALQCLDANARKQRLTRLVSKLTKLRVKLQLPWKVERAADCSGEIGTAYIATVTMRPISAADRR
jgi:hypothetical protein